MRLAQLTLLSFAMLGSTAMPLAPQTFGVSVPPGDNFDTAEFRLWVPEGVEILRGILVLVPGSNGDGRGEVEDSTWRELAVKHDLALLGVHMTNRRHLLGSGIRGGPAGARVFLHRRGGPGVP